jgi:hypothetical protein
MPRRAASPARSTARASPAGVVKRRASPKRTPPPPKVETPDAAPDAAPATESVEAFTRATMNRPLQALFLAIFIVPQVLTYLHYDGDMTAYSELRSMFAPTVQLSCWQRWLQTEKFLVVLVCLSIERIVYTVVWLFPAHFVHFAQHSPLRRVVFLFMGKAEPLDMIVFLFWISKIFQARRRNDATTQRSSRARSSPRSLARSSPFTSRWRRCRMRATSRCCGG